MDYLYRSLSRNKQLVRAYCNKSKEVIVPKGKYITEPWNERKGVWKSTFSFFEPKTPFFGPDYIRLMQTPIDLSPSGVKKWYESRTENQELANQSFMQERYAILGADLAAAHFVVYRGGAVRFYNESDWVRKDKFDNYILPKHYIPGLYLDAIDCEGINLRTTGLENILNLTKLRWLSLGNNPQVDDWMLDAVSGSYRKTLEHLNISNCPRITYKGLSCFYRFSKLNTLDLTGLSDSYEFKLACLMLEDIFPKMNLIGVQHELPKLEDKKIGQIEGGE